MTGTTVTVRFPMQGWPCPTGPHLPQPGGAITFQDHEAPDHRVVERTLDDLDLGPVRDPAERLYYLMAHRIGPESAGRYFMGSLGPKGEPVEWSACVVDLTYLDEARKPARAPNPDAFRRAWAEDRPGTVLSQSSESALHVAFMYPKAVTSPELHAAALRGARRDVGQFLHKYDLACREFRPGRWSSGFSISEGDPIWRMMPRARRNGQLIYSAPVVGSGDVFDALDLARRGDSTE